MQNGLQGGLPGSASGGAPVIVQRPTERESLLILRVERQLAAVGQELLAAQQKAQAIAAVYKDVLNHLREDSGSSWDPNLHAWVKAAPCEPCADTERQDETVPVRVRVHREEGSGE